MDTLITVAILLAAFAFLAMAAWLLNDWLQELLGRYPYDEPEDTDD